MSSLNKSNLENRLRQTIAWLKTLPASTKLTFDGNTFAPSHLVRAFETELSADAEVSARRADYKAAVERDKLARAEALPLFSGVQEWARLTYGKQSAMLEPAGFQPIAKRYTSVAAKAQGAQKAQATRAALRAVGATPNGQHTGTTGTAAAA